MTICKWPTKPLSQVQVTVGETSMMATPERAYFDSFTVAEAVKSERERCAEIARNGCLVPPDGGSPTEEEAALCEEIARRIRGA